MGHSPGPSDPAPRDGSMKQSVPGQEGATDLESAQRCSTFGYKCSSLILLEAFTSPVSWVQNFHSQRRRKELKGF